QESGSLCITAVEGA
ncbi:hypothetical protein A2U01_0097004, partial [Trifolium medium]|nr:hypothetical protein [Trifolium medium]